MLTSGTRLGPYEIEAPIGSGGMGEVYRARDARLGRQVAVKILPPEFAASAERRARFEREARTVGSLNHPNLLTLFDVGFEGHLPFLVTELLEGASLRQLVARGPIRQERALRFAAGTARGLAAAHERGIVHRDLKPENLFVTRDDHIKILDFGLARLMSGGIGADLPTEPGEVLTAVGAIVGTPAYLSPEQIRGEPGDQRIDLFALGVVLFEMLLGRRPFEGASIPEILSAVLHRNPPELERDGELPERVRPLLARCLARDPAQRPGSARDLAVELEQLAAVPAPTLSTPPAAALPSTPVLAVLPFANLTGNAGSEFLCDGLAEQILNSLARLPGIKVLARATCFRFRDRAGEPVEVGQELRVTAVVSGRVYRVSGRLVVRAELTDVREERQLWGDQYDRPSDDLLAVQVEIGSEVARALGSQLASSPRERLARPLTENPRAYEFHLKGRFSLNRRTLDTMREAIRMFDEAVQADPRYALAWSGLADSWLLVSRYGGASPREAMPRAREAALRALEIDEEMAEAHVSLGQVFWYYDWDIAATEREFRRALALNPNYAQAHHWLAFNLAEVGRFEEAENEIARALALDPLSLIIRANAGTISYLARRYQEAVERASRALELDPHFVVALLWRSRALRALGRTEEALADLRLCDGLVPDDAETLATLGYTLAVGGASAEARDLARRLETLRASRYVSPYFRAVLFAGLEDEDALIATLEEALDSRTDWLVTLPVEPVFDPYRDRPRFRAIVERVRPRSRAG